MQHPRICDLGLNIYLFRPVGIAGLAQLIAQLDEGGEVRSRSVYVAGTSSTERAGEVSNGIGIRKLARPNLQLGCALPIAALNHVASFAGSSPIVTRVAF